MKRVHFIGVCGTAMATLAAMLKQRGFDVQGSDHGVYPPMSDFLAREQVRVFDGYRAEQITGDIDTVVTFTLTPTASGTLLSIVQAGFKAHQKQNFGGARYGWRMMGEKLVDALARMS